MKSKWVAPVWEPLPEAAHCVKCHGPTTPTNKKARRWNQGRGTRTPDENATRTTRKHDRVRGSRRSKTRPSTWRWRNPSKKRVPGPEKNRRESHCQLVNGLGRGRGTAKGRQAIHTPITRETIAAQNRSVSFIGERVTWVRFPSPAPLGFKDLEGPCGALRHLRPGSAGMESPAAAPAMGRLA